VPKFRFISSVVAVTAILLAPGATAAQAATAGPARQHVVAALRDPGEPAEFRIANAASGVAQRKCIGIAAGQAGLWPCTTGNDQVWRWGYPKTPGSSWKALTNRDGLCLSVAGSSTQKNARLLAFRCVGTDDQYWDFGDTGVYSSDGHYTSPLFNYHGVYTSNAGAWLAGAQSGSMDTGTPVILWSYDGTGNQYWYQYEL
jgi:hypothetical protein